ncbi:uncharacterized protein SPAPADRAFT_50456 [Spathaspora passalidarum NRRL Y-27907]|uniref:CDC20/Fizzy WD40 domain-containing protein n=1 Tax=Spathaspora passalidarum (strain NRRL Y-27907 / 11-Y1) TaxID=619300 RepID=G3AKI9_SPAPN|nr:uncharacterized protein SPAPADRAFT_50456 [Spathaspora passalidarum NRRL Y-27907]EGW33594.1 hypothetical protein SPAPADRAFT_50456 [Spathaspora passalidarum NRRL Y-27907]
MSQNINPHGVSSSSSSSSRNGNTNKSFGYETPQSPSRSTRISDPPRLEAGLPTTATSPRRRMQNNIFSDRYIPNRTGIDLQTAFSLTNDEIIPGTNKNIDNEIEIRKEEEANRTFTTVLKAELFGDNVVSSSLLNGRGVKGRPNNTNNTRESPSTSNTGTPPRSSASASSTPNVGAGAASGTAADTDDVTSTPRRKVNLFTYQSPQKSRPISRDLQQELYSLSPVRHDTQKILLSPQKKPRTISKVPYRVLDAPELSDDFYLNLVDWGAQDILAVGLGDSVYLWDGSTQSVDRLCNLNKDKVTSLNWIGSGTHLAIGTLKGMVEIWDATKIKCIRTMSGHSLRVSSLAWNEHILSSGSRDRSILNRDVRIEDHYVNKFESHKQEVCGLKWNVEENKLASGGNDNNLFVWDGLNPTPLYHFTDHTAAVKAIAWSPHQRGILASGGGTADKTIKIWNTLTGNLVNDVNTGSQVCNLIWSKNSNELVSTHGYSRNQIIVWKYPSMQQIAQLTGHTYRVLYLSLSPDGETIVTGAGDETLRFWNVFEKSRQEQSSSVLLGAFSQLR